MEPITFFVSGHPRPAGSKRAFPIYRGKRGETRTFTGRSIVVDSSGQAGKDWRGDIQAAAARHYQGVPLTCPVCLSLHFLFERPKNHLGSGMQTGIVRASAPEYHITKPDVLKLARAVEDALTGIIWHDDSQIINEELTKGYAWGGPGGVKIQITPK
jgi:crossover junction endodeoxyribonuclease RusA